MVSWTIVVPVQDGALGKTRLSSVPRVARACLARAFAADCLAAVADCPLVSRILVVTSDPRTAVVATNLGAQVLADPGGGLLAAVRLGRSWALESFPLAPTAVLLGDLPALQAADLTSALTRCLDFDFAVIPDLDGTGSVLLSGRTAFNLRMAFGANSARAHVDLGAQRLEVDLPRLRRDVDLMEHLALAQSWGVGPASTAALAALAASL